jgi:hypothetical protein
MANLNAGVTITPGAAAGVGATASLPSVSADGLDGIAVVTTGAVPGAAGALAVIHLASSIIADQDAATAMLATQGYPGATNAGAHVRVPVVVVNATAPPVPPAGVLVAAVLTHAQGQLTGFGIAVSGLLAPNTTYRFTWRVLG